MSETFLSGAAIFIGGAAAAAVLLLAFGRLRRAGRIARGSPPRPGPERAAKILREAGERSRERLAQSPDGRLRALGVRDWTTYDAGDARARWLPLETEGLYLGKNPIAIRCGAFAGWPARQSAALADAIEAGGATQAAAHLLHIHHQAAGHDCTYVQLFAIPCAVAPGQVEFVRTLCGDHYHSAASIAAYEERLAARGLTANRALAGEGRATDLIESVYPLDAGEHNIRLLLADPEAVLAALAPLLAWPTLGETARLYILADNSD